MDGMFFIPGRTPVSEQSNGGGLFDPIYQAMQRQQPAPITLPPAANPMAGINPMYTRQMPMNSLAPMGMYQAYKQSGQMPAETNNFQPQAAQPGMMGAPSQPASIPMGNK